jgi:hypothetical protein
MAGQDKRPGVSRAQRISEEGLQRLERQLQRGARISEQVKQQWVKRYGKPAIDIFSRYADKRSDD